MRNWFYFFLFALSFYLFSDSAPSHLSFQVTKPITKSSSYLKEKKRSYPPQQAVDSKLETAWCEGVVGAGIGETFQVEFHPTEATRITLLNGYGENKNLYEINNRVKDYEIKITSRNGQSFKQKGKLNENGCLPGDERECIHLMDDQLPKQYEACMQELNKHCNETEDSLGNDIIFKEPLCITKIEFKILSVYQGKKFNDTCIAEIKLVKPDPSNPINNQDEILKLEKVCK